MAPAPISLQDPTPPRVLDELSTQIDKMAPCEARDRLLPNELRQEHFVSALGLQI